MYYCEVNHLLLLPPLSLDPVAEQFQDNCKAVEMLDLTVREFKEQLTSTLSVLVKDISGVGKQVRKLKDRTLQCTPLQSSTCTFKGQSAPVWQTERRTSSAFGVIILSVETKQPDYLWSGRIRFDYKREGYGGRMFKFCSWSPYCN